MTGAHPVTVAPLVISISGALENKGALSSRSWTPCQHSRRNKSIHIFAGIILFKTDSVSMILICGHLIPQESEAMDYIFGYTVAHDVSARDWQLEPGKNGGQWVIGKAMDGFCPLGPVIVTKEELSGGASLATKYALLQKRSRTTPSRKSKSEIMEIGETCGLLIVLCDVLFQCYSFHPIKLYMTRKGFLSDSYKCTISRIS